MLKHFFRREITSPAELEQFRMATLTLQGRVDRLIEDQTTRRLRHQSIQSTCRYYN
jgi:hypothetical protein